MKKLSSFFAISFLLFVILSSCKKDKENADTPEYIVNQAYSLTNISYGSDNQQKMDIYLPKDRSSSSTKVFVLVHGGGWNAGDKADFNSFVSNLKTLYPNHAIINLNYRLATIASPGYPKQINDIKAAIDHIKQARYNVSNQFFMIGGSAGAHLSLLYGYKFDPNSEVKGICNWVGPVDFTDPSYTEDPTFQYALSYLVGPQTYVQNPSLHAEVSPALAVSTTSPKTISFYGDSDHLIPSTQMNLLHGELDAKGIYNEKTMYVGEGHGAWSQANATDFALKLANFINQHFN